MKTEIFRLSLLGLPFFLMACNPWQAQQNSADEKVDAISRAMEDQECPVEGCYWLEVQGFDGNWIKVGLIFGFLGNRDVCEQISAELTTPPGYPLLERQYRCASVNSAQSG